MFGFLTQFYFCEFCGKEFFNSHACFSAIVTLAEALVLSLESEKENGPGKNSQPLLNATTKILSIADRSSHD